MWRTSGVILHIVKLRFWGGYFNWKYYDKTNSPFEEEEGKKCWWLCYIMEK